MSPVLNHLPRCSPLLCKVLRTIFISQINIFFSTGVPFIAWRLAVQPILGCKNMLSHVFHNMNSIHPVTMQTDPEIINPSDLDTKELSDNYIKDLEQWFLGEIESKNIFPRRFPSTICPLTIKICLPHSFLILL